MKKIIAILLLSVFLGSCSFLGKKEKEAPKTETVKKVEVKSGDFNSLYSAYLTNKVSKVKEAVKLAKIFEAKKAVGDFSLKAGVGALGNIDASMKMDGLTNGTESKTIFSDVNISGNIPMQGPLNVKAKEVGVIQTMAKQLVSFKGLEVPEQFTQQIAGLMKYEGKWLELPSQNSAAETKIITNIMNLTTAEINDYIVKYPVFKTVGKAKVDGTKNTFTVELDAEKMLELQKALYTKLEIEEKISEDDINDFKEDIKEANSKTTITLTFDEKNIDFVEAKVYVKDEKKPGTITVNSDKDIFHADITLDSKEKVFFLDITTKDNTTNFVFEGGDVAKVKGNGTVITTDNMMTTFTFNIESDKMKGNIDYNYKDNNFTGKAKFVSDDETVTIDTTGTIKDKTLQTFTFNLTGPNNTNVVIETKDAKDGIMSGTLSVVAGEEIKADAKMNLGLGEEIFALGVNEINIEKAPMIAEQQKALVKQANFDMVIKVKQEATTEKVTIPGDVIPFKEVQKAIQGQSNVPQTEEK